jgi:hypothetical protein
LCLCAIGHLPDYPRQILYRSVFTATVLVIFISLSGCHALPRKSHSADPGSQLDSVDDPGRSHSKIDAFALQSRVMGMADDYASEISEIVYLLLKPVATTSQERTLVQSYVRNSFGAAEIASSPNPETSLLDPIVLERHRIPEIWGKARGGPSLERLRKFEVNLWARSDILLSEKQKSTRFDRKAPAGEVEEKETMDTRELMAKTIETADHLTALLDRADQLLESPRWNERIGEFDLLTTKMINRIFLWLALLVAVVFAGIGLLRVVPRR